MQGTSGVTKMRHGECRHYLLRILNSTNLRFGLCTVHCRVKNFHKIQIPKCNLCNTNLIVKRRVVGVPLEDTKLDENFCLGVRRVHFCVKNFYQIQIPKCSVCKTHFECVKFGQ